MNRISNVKSKYLKHLTICKETSCKNSFKIKSATNHIYIYIYIYKGIGIKKCTRVDMPLNTNEPTH